MNDLPLAAVRAFLAEVGAAQDSPYAYPPTVRLCPFSGLVLVNMYDPQAKECRDFVLEDETRPLIDVAREIVQQVTRRAPQSFAELRGERLEAAAE